MPPSAIWVCVSSSSSGSTPPDMQLGGEKRRKHIAEPSSKTECGLSFELNGLRVSSSSGFLPARWGSPARWYFMFLGRKVYYLSSISCFDLFSLNSSHGLFVLAGCIPCPQTHHIFQENLKRHILLHTYDCVLSRRELVF